MHTQNQIKEFLSAKSFAFAGLSRDEKKFSRLLFQKLKEQQYSILPVNPQAEEISGTRCFASVSALPEGTEKLYIVTGKSNTTQTVREAIQKGIRKVWIQQGCDTPEAIALLKDSRTEYIRGECLFMWLEPVSGMHKFHRNLKRIFGGLPKKQ